MSDRDIIINALMFINRQYIEEHYTEYEIIADEKQIYEYYNSKTTADLLVELLTIHSDIKFEALTAYIKNF